MMAMPLPQGPDITRSALLIVDMQNDFVHPEGGFAHRARENPEAQIDMPFLMGTVGPAARLAAAFRKPGVRSSISRMC
jgi:nicotinamidase-related amidase